MYCKTAYLYKYVEFFVSTHLQGLYPLTNMISHVFFQLCQVLSPTSMLCQAPELPISLARQQEVPERPDEFGFKLDDVQALMALNNTNFIYYPNPEFEPLSVSGVLELKPGSPIILKVGGLSLLTHIYLQSDIQFFCHSNFFCRIGL